MPKRLSYTVVTKVTQTWDYAKRLPHFEERVGTDLLLKLFELEPRTKTVFHFDLEYNPTAEELKESGNLRFAFQMLDSFDSCIHTLGPETEILYEILGDLGRRHRAYGVSPHFFPFFGQAMVFAMGNILGPEIWTKELRGMWQQLYDSFSGIMMKAILDLHLQGMMPTCTATAYDLKYGRRENDKLNTNNNNNINYNSSQLMNTQPPPPAASPATNAKAKVEKIIKASNASKVSSSSKVVTASMAETKASKARAI